MPKKHKSNESDGEVDDGDSDEERAKVANINSMDPLQWSMHKRGITKNMENHADNFDMQQQDYSIQKNQQNIFVQDDYGYSAGKVPKVQRNPGELNPGERLYYRAVNHLGNKQQAIEQ